MSKNETQSQLSVREQALRSARHHLQTKGFNGFSFQAVADDLGIRKASLHYYFSSKDQLGLALLVDYQKAFEEWAAKTKKLETEDKVENLIGLFVGLSEKGSKICPLGALCADFNSLSNELQKKLVELNHMQKKWLVELLEEGQKKKLISQRIDTQVAASGLMAQIQGGLQIARITGDAKSFRAQLVGAFQLLRKSI